MTISSFVIWVTIFIKAAYSHGLTGSGSALFRMIDDAAGSREWMVLPDGGADMQNISMGEDQNEISPYYIGDLSAGVGFRLFTRKNRDYHQMLAVTSNIKETNFAPSKHTLFLIHGWSHDAYKIYNIQLTEVYLNRSDMNIIVVDWSNISQLPYVQSRLQIGRVANDVAVFIAYLIDKLGHPPENIHMWGYSLGAHVAGLSAKKLRGPKIATIIGVEPAMPLFSINHPNKRLARTDATYVEVIHAAGGTIGFYSPLGHVDFYPNGGRQQPGCETELYGGCSHFKATGIFVEALTDPNDLAIKCSSMDELFRGFCSDSGVYRRMGDLTRPVSPEQYGVYWLKT